MYDFLDRLVMIALPRVRDFRGIRGKNLDGRGNFDAQKTIPVLPTNSGAAILTASGIPCLAIGGARLYRGHLLFCRLETWPSG